MVLSRGRDALNASLDGQPAQRTTDVAPAVGVKQPLSVAVLGWAALDTVDGPLVVAALGYVVGAIPAAITRGLSSPAGHRLIATLVTAALLYALSLMLDPLGAALGTAARQRITGQLQARLLNAVTAPVTVAHLEDQATLDRLASAEGSLTGFFPGDAPVTWVGSVATRLSGVVGCALIAAYFWWLGLVLLVIWLTVRRVILKSVLKQAVDMRGQTTEMRRAWYFTGVGSKARDAKEIRVFGLARFVAGRYRRHFSESIRAGRVGLRGLHRRAAACFVVVLGGYALAVYTITDAARTHEIGTRSLAIMLPMLAITAAAGNVSLDDITLAWTLHALPDADRLERDLRPPSELDGATDPGDAPQQSVRFEGVRFRYPSGRSDVLAGVDLELAAGTSTALVGVNGAGKSTLVSLLARLRDPTGGQITVDGTDVRALNPGRWQRAIALMPQDPGQWQKLALGRAMRAPDPLLVDLDEPTASLDAHAEHALFERYQAAADDAASAGTITLLVSHRFSTVRMADLIVYLEAGHITEAGTHEELLAANGRYAELFNLQAAAYR